jgi:hypothetical protein
MLAFGVEQPPVGAADAIGAQRLLEVVGLEQDARPVMVRSSTGAEASEVSADQICSFTSG